jgi:hypothetical protein
MGVVGDLKFRHPKTGAMSSALTVTSNSAQGVRDVISPGLPTRVFETGIPFVLPPGDGATSGLSFNGGGGGAFTLSAAIIIGAGAGLSDCYIWLPANAGSSGCEMGWYYAQFSSDTTGTIYGNKYTSGRPTIPSAPTVFQGAPTGRITTPTGTIDGPEFVLPGKVVGRDGTIDFLAKIYATANANVKTITLQAGSSSIGYYGPGATPVVDVLQTVQNRGRYDRQHVTRATTSIGGTSASFAGNFTSVDFSVNQTIKATLRVSIATDGLILSGFCVTITPSE